MAHGVTDGDYRFAPDGPGDEPAPGKGVKREAIEGSFLLTGPGRYQAPPSYFLIRGDAESRGSLMKPGFVSVITYGNPPTEIPPADGHTSGRRRALAEWLGSPENPLTARVAVNRIWQPSFRAGHRGHAGQFRQDGREADASGTAGLAGGRVHEARLELQADAPADHDVGRLSRCRRNSRTRAIWRRIPTISTSWRFRIQRLDAEIVRDSIMAASGTLNLEMFGPPVFPQAAGGDSGIDAIRASGSGKRTVPRCGGAASTFIASAACRFRCSRRSTCRIKT